jgi:hypothetical protein
MTSFLYSNFKMTFCRENDGPSPNFLNSVLNVSVRQITRQSVIQSANSNGYKNGILLVLDLGTLIIIWY